jgi:hypothetical protein
VLIAGDIMVGLDPALIGQRVGLQLDDWQAEVIRARPKRGLWLCARQTGKTTTALLTTLWTVLYEAPALCLIISPSLRQSSEAFRSFMQLYRKLDGAPRLTSESALRCEIEGGSRVVSLPGTEKTVRGYAGAKLIVCDEAARIDDTLMAAIRPMLATVDGSLLMLSTPAGKRGTFFTSWTEGGDDWQRVRVPASACRRLPAWFLEEEKRELGDLMFRQEYLLEFLDDGLAVFPFELVERAFDPQLRSIW